VQILLNPAHNYSTYRDTAIDYVAENDLPLMPTVHGGGIVPSIGGTPEEPIFRAQPQDSGQASVAIMEALERGDQSIAILATQIDGSQFMKAAAISGANELGLDIVAELDIPTLASDYSAEINRIKDAAPDEVFIASQAQDGGVFVKQMAEAGMTDVDILGSSEWTGGEFVEAATPEALQAHKAVLVAGWTAQEGPAFDAYAEGWNASEYADLADPNNSYNIAYHDALVLAALAIEKAGEVSASSYANTIRDVSMAPGTQCSTYAECLALLRAGEDIDYEGASGSNNFTETGVIDGNPAVQEWQFGEDPAGSLTLVNTPDAAGVAELENAFNATLEE
jgi:ABC-type branched-subunit amino acid transport system substrate-binding protein